MRLTIWLTILTAATAAAEPTVTRFDAPISVSPDGGTVTDFPAGSVVFPPDAFAAVDTAVKGLQDTNTNQAAQIESLKTDLSAASTPVLKALVYVGIGLAVGVGATLGVTHPWSH